MIPITDDSLVGNGFEVINNSELSPKTLRFSITGTIAIATSKAQPLFSSFRTPALDPFLPLLSSRCLKSRISPMGPSPLSVSSAVTVNWISGENIFNSLKKWFIPMSEQKSLLTYMRFRSFMVRIWWSLSLTTSRLGSILIPDLGNRCPDIKKFCSRVTDVLIFKT